MTVEQSRYFRSGGRLQAAVLRGQWPVPATSGVVVEFPGHQAAWTVEWSERLGGDMAAGVRLSVLEESMVKSGGSVSTGSATRLVYVIGVLKWVALAVIALGVVGATALSFAGGGDQFGPAISLIVWVYGIVAGIAVYVMMGWLQQTLLMLIGIAKNTAKDDLLSRI